MRRIIVISFIIVIPFLSHCAFSVENSHESPGNTTYYVNPVDGNDENSGLKEERAWRTFIRINALMLAPGDRVEITAPGAFYHSLVLKGQGATEKPVEVHFAPGCYDFFTDHLTRKKYNISNTNAQPDSLKAIGILLEGARHMKITGPGAKIMCRGKMIEVCVDSCENIHISDLQFDYYRPTVSEFKVLQVKEDEIEMLIHEDSKYKIKNGNLIWYGEGWTYDARLLGQELNPESNDVRRLWNPIEGMQFEEIEPGLVKARGKHKVKKDCIYQLRDPFRDYAAVFTRRSKNITWKNVDFYFLHGMGLVSQFSENLTYDSVSVAPEKNSGRTTAAWADILHVSGCKGKVVVKDFTFKGAHDDAINIHGTYLRVVEIRGDKQIKVRFMHKQTYGFMAVNPGDEIEFVDDASYASLGKNKVIDAEMLNPREILLSLEKSVPQNLELEDVIENVTWTPEVEISGCHVSWIPTRGFLLATRRKILVEENEFLATHMGAILVGIDANNWYESGFVRNMTIRNNKFINCAEPVIQIEPRNQKENNRVHQNIRIKNNEFLLRNKMIFKAKSASNLTIEGNTISSEKKLNNAMVVEIEDCAELKMGENQYLKNQ